MKHFVRLVFLAFFCGGVSGGQTPPAAPQPLTLDEAVRLALANNPELRAAEARVEAATGRAKQAQRWSNPELELHAEDWPVRGGRGFADAKQTLGVAQTLPYPGKKALDGQVGGAGVKLMEAELAVRRTEIVRDVKAGFFRALAAERWIAVAAELVAVAEASAATARKRVEAGAAAYHEQLRAEVQLEQARTAWTGFQRERATARQSLATLLGLARLGGRKLAGTLVETADAALLVDLADERLAKHPSLGAARANLEYAQLESRRARLEPYPDIRVGVAGGRIGESDQTIIQAGLALPLPLLDRGQGKQQAARALTSAAEAELRAAQQQVQREWANAQQRYRTAAAQVANYRERILPKAAEALRLIQTGFEQGKFNFLDLVDTQRTTAEVRLAYQEKLLELNITQAELEALLQPPVPTSANTP
jgi:cobalt-zinc-cadmium efflux system outer membrane protein